MASGAAVVSMPCSVVHMANLPFPQIVSTKIVYAETI
jgi:hypothetical protein